MFLSGAYFGSFSWVVVFWESFREYFRKEEAERREGREWGKSLRGMKGKQTCFSGFWTRIARRRGEFDSIMLWEISGGGWELFLLLWRRGAKFPTSLASTIPALLYRVMSPYKRDVLRSRCLKKVLAGALKEGIIPDAGDAISDDVIVTCLASRISMQNRLLFIE